MNTPPESHPDKNYPEDGHPWFTTRGLLNILPYIFENYRPPDTSSNIYDPTANASAAMSYMMDRYDLGESEPGDDDWYDDVLSMITDDPPSQ